MHSRAALLVGNSVGIGQLDCHRIHLLQLPLDMSVSVTNHPILHGFKLFYDIHKFCGSGYQTGLLCMGPQLGRFGELAVTRMGGSWSPPEASSLMGLSFGLAGTVHCSAWHGLCRWLGLPFNMVAPGWSDDSYSSSWLQERVDAARWTLPGF